MAYSAIRALHNAKLVQNLKTVNFVIRNVIMRNGTVLFVNTDRDALLWRVTQHFARRAGQPYILHKWVGGTLTNFLATQRYYARKQHVSANIQSTPDLIFCSNVAENRRLFDEANQVMIPTVGVMHENTRNRSFSRDPNVTYPLPTFAPKSLSTIYFCNKIISDVILHHRRKQATYALYSIPPASTSAASTLLSPMARARLSTAQGPDRDGLKRVAAVDAERGGFAYIPEMAEFGGVQTQAARVVQYSDTDELPSDAELLLSEDEADARVDFEELNPIEWKSPHSIEDASDSDRARPNGLARLHLTPQGIRGAPPARPGVRTAAAAAAAGAGTESADDLARYHDVVQEIVGEDVALPGGAAVRTQRSTTLAAALARGRGGSSARVTGSAGVAGGSSALDSPLSASTVAAAKAEAAKAARTAREMAARDSDTFDAKFAFGAQRSATGQFVAVSGRDKYVKELFPAEVGAHHRVMRHSFNASDAEATDADAFGAEADGDGEGAPNADGFEDDEFAEFDLSESAAPAAPAAPPKPAAAAGAGAGAGAAAGRADK